MNERAAKIRNRITRLRREAHRLGIELPADLVRVLDTEPPLPMTVPEARAAARVAILDSVSQPSAQARRAVREALDEVARAEAVRYLRDEVAAALAEQRWEAVTAASGEIEDRVEAALQADFEALAEVASSAPVLANPTPDLSPEAFERYYLVRRSAQRLDTAAQILSLIRPLPEIENAKAVPDQRARLNFLALPDEDLGEAASVIRSAITGKDTSGKNEVLWPSAIATQLPDVEFALVDRDVAKDNVKRLAVELMPTTTATRANVFGF